MLSILNYFKKFVKSQQRLSINEKSVINEFNKLEISDRQKALIQSSKSKEMPVSDKICPCCNRPL
jgi:hypothetical protein